MPVSTALPTLIFTELPDVQQHCVLISYHHGVSKTTGYLLRFLKKSLSQQKNVDDRKYLCV